MTIKQFIDYHKEEIDQVIQGQKNDRERRLWILNDEGLYLWAKSEGVVGL